jgi:hypothetical protein
MTAFLFDRAFLLPVRYNGFVICRLCIGFVTDRNRVALFSRFSGAIFLQLKRGVRFRHPSFLCLEKKIPIYLFTS